MNQCPIAYSFLLRNPRYSLDSGEDPQPQITVHNHVDFKLNFNRIPSVFPPKRHAGEKDRRDSRVI